MGGTKEGRVIGKDEYLFLYLSITFLEAIFIIKDYRFQLGSK